MDGILAVGEVPDEVLLLCGQSRSAPSAWWTPSLTGLDEGQLRRRVEAARTTLQQAGLYDPTTGELSGVLADVATVVAGARLVLLVEAGHGRQAPRRRSVVVATDRAMLDVHDPTAGSHDLSLVGPRAAVALLAEVLAPATARPSGRVRRLAGRRSPDDVAGQLPERERTATTRITRTAVARDGDPGGVHLVTVVEHPEGAVACWALPGGGVHVQVLDEDGVVDLALALLGADTAEVAA